MAIRRAAGTFFSGHFGNRDQQRVRARIARQQRTMEGIVLIARDRVLRPRGKRNVHAGHGGRMLGDQPLLDFAPDFQIPFRRCTIRQLDREKDK